MAATSRIAELALTIQVESANIEKHLLSQGLKAPSWDLDTPPQIPLLTHAAQASQNAVLEAMDELKALILGPIPSLINKATDAHNGLLGIQAIYRFNIASSFPVGSETTFPEIAERCGQNEDDLRRLLHFAMTDRIFKEPRKGVVAHTPASKALNEHPMLRACLGQLCEELWPAASRTIDAMVKWPGSEEPSQTGFSYANNTNDPFFVDLGKNPYRAKRFADSITLFHMKPGFEHAHIVENYDWAAVGNGLLVDVGGSHGTVSQAIAESFPNIRCIVEDLPEVIKTANVPEGLTNRFEFIAHDFFTEQPIRGADIYLLRWVLHDWSDKYALKIVKSLIPALKHGAKVVVNEFCLPEPGEMTPYQEKQARNLDLGMKELLNAKERTSEEWKQLFHDADPRFKLFHIKKPPASELSIVEFTWEQEAPTTNGHG